MARGIEYETTLHKDVSESYANVAAHGQNKLSYCGTLQRLAKAFLKWDKTADKAERRDLQRFATFSLTQDNCRQSTVRSFQECFGRALASSAENDRPTAAYLSSEHRSETSNQNRRADFSRAITDGATDETIKRALASNKE